MNGSIDLIGVLLKKYVKFLIEEFFVECKTAVETPYFLASPSGNSLSNCNGVSQVMDRW